MFVDSTGRFTGRTDAAKHLQGTVKNVIISEPAKNEDLTIIQGVNNERYDASKHPVVSSANCATNCFGPVAKVPMDNFGILKGRMSAIHSDTNDQVILDFSHDGLLRSRAAAINRIPTSTGAAMAIGLVLTLLNGKLDGNAMRVPRPNVSVVDFVAVNEKSTSIEEVNKVVKAAAAGPLNGIQAYTEDELVSTDMQGNPNSIIIDAGMTRVLDGSLVKVASWYGIE